MFYTGDKVVYPMYGAGVIEDVEQKDVDGATRSYYVLRLPIGNLKIMVSVTNAESLRIRSVLPSEDLIATLDSVSAAPACAMADNWNQRYKDNMEKIKTGDLFEVGEVFRSLRQRERDRGLSSAEKKMLSTVKQILLSEIILSHNVERPAAESILEKTI